MTIFRSKHIPIWLTAILCGCAAERATPRNELERAILSGKPEFTARVQELGKTDWSALKGEMLGAGFQREAMNGCEHYRYDRQLDSMGQRVTAQVFKCAEKLDSELGYTFL